MEMISTYITLQHQHRHSPLSSLLGRLGFFTNGSKLCSFFGFFATFLVVFVRFFDPVGRKTIEIRFDDRRNHSIDLRNNERRRRRSRSRSTTRNDDNKERKNEGLVEGVLYNNVPMEKSSSSSSSTKSSSSSSPLDASKSESSSTSKSLLSPSEPLSSLKRGLK